MGSKMARRVKILEVLEANVGGARKHVLDILRCLDRSRFEPHVACSLRRGFDAPEALRQFETLGAKTTVVPMLRRPAPLADLRSLRDLGRLIRRERFAIVHTHASKAGFLGRLAARRAGVAAVVHTPHTFPFERRDTSLAPLYCLLERWAAGWADRIVLVAPSQRATAEQLGVADQRLVVIENGVEPPAEPPETLRARYREKLGLAADEPAFAFVARLTPQKDVQSFLRVAGEVFRLVPEAKGFVVGATDNPAYLRSLRPRPSPQSWRTLTEDKPAEGLLLWSDGLPLRVLGHRSDAPSLVAAFDLVILPSLYEGLPYSLLEAMACGVPVVASNVTGARDAIVDGETGFLVPVGDVTAFARAAAKVLTDRALRLRLGAAARERALGHFSLERFAERINALYGELAPASHDEPEQRNETKGT